MDGAIREMWMRKKKHSGRSNSRERQEKVEEMDVELGPLLWLMERKKPNPKKEEKEGEEEELEKKR